MLGAGAYRLVSGGVERVVERRWTWCAQGGSRFGGEGAVEGCALIWSCRELKRCNGVRALRKVRSGVEEAKPASGFFQNFVRSPQNTFNPCKLAKPDGGFRVRCRRVSSLC